MSRSTLVRSRSEAVLSLVGNTPLVPLHFEAERLTIYAKCEIFNPSGSIKDRFAKCVLVDAEQRGALRPDSIIVECSSGNTGIALSMIGATLGYPVRILMSASASEERRQLIRQLGAELVLFDSGGKYQTGIEMSRAMAANDARIFLPRQFENSINAADHEHCTGQEILRQMPGPIDRRWPAARIIAMEPAEQALLAGECPCCHFIEGVADGFIPPLLRDAPLDGEVKITSAEAMAMTRRLHREFGLLVGTSSGANVSAALRLAQDLGPRATVVTLLCDRAERYFSTALFAAPEN